MTNDSIPMNSRYEGAADRARFVGAFVLVAIVLTSILVLLDFVPEAPTQDTMNTTSSSTATTVTPAVSTTVEVRTPVRIQIPARDIDTSIVTPQSTDISVLDRALLTGAVHYPGSAYAGEQGNMLIFGHSSYLPVVKNKSFQAFNDLGKSKRGELITILSSTHEYTYTIDSVTLMRAEDAVVPLNVTQPTLTLATCNTFGAKQERWVVIAHLTGKKEL
jgi:LPXTG-site transpeptidase (sortase) family protein